MVLHSCPINDFLNLFYYYEKSVFIYQDTYSNHLYKKIKPVETIDSALENVL